MQSRVSPALAALLLGCVSLPMASSFLPVSPHSSVSLRLGQFRSSSTCAALQPNVFQPVLSRKDQRPHVGFGVLMAQTPLAVDEGLTMKGEGGTEKKQVRRRRRSPPKKTEAEMTEAVREEELMVAFNAFASCLLRPKGRVRFATINSAFRSEFPSLASEERLNNVTLGRMVQRWYEKETGEKMAKTSGGAYSKLTLLNPAYTATDLTSLRAAQALFEPEKRRLFDALGLSNFQESQGAQERRGAKKQGGARGPRAEGATGNRRNDAKGKGKGKGRQQKDQEEDAGKALRRTITTCVDAYANTMLDNHVDGAATFQEVLAAFRGQFPLLATNDRLEPAVFGRILAQWYFDKYGEPLSRNTTMKTTRANQAYVKLRMKTEAGFRPDQTLINEAKILLRRSMKMEGVGVMVKKTVQGNYAVATLLPGSPGANNGNIQPGDVILAVGGEEVAGMSPQDLAAKVLGPRGTFVSLTLRRPAAMDESAGELERVFSVRLKRSDKAVMGDDIQKEETRGRARLKQRGN